MSEKLGGEVVELFDRLSAKRDVWNNLWQLVASYMRGSNDQFNVRLTQGQRKENEMRVGVGMFASQSLASALIGMLWPNGAQSMQIVKSPSLSESKENIEYFQAVTEKMQQAMDDPRASLAVALTEYMLDQVSYGTSGMGVFEGQDSLLSFQAWGTAQTFIDEGADAKVSEKMRSVRWRLSRVIEEFGVENLSDKLQSAAENVTRLFDEVEILQLVKKREKRDVTKDDNKNMPFMSVWVEKDTKHVLRESGFLSEPVHIARLIKFTNEIYGRSNGIFALSDILEQEFLIERFSVHAEKSESPPLVVLDSGTFGGSVIDTSARAINVMDVSGREPNNIDPIKPMFTVGNPAPLLERINELQERISQHFLLDQILDIGGSTSMTATEVITRERIRAASLGSLFVRQVAEMFDPMITRVFSMLFAKGELGVVSGSAEEQAILAEGREPIIIPDDIAQKIGRDEDFFEIKYFTPAARMMQAQKAEALGQVTGFAGQLAQLSPDVLDVFDADEGLRIAAETAGLNEVIQGEDEVKAMREARAKAAQEAAQAEQQQAQASALKDVGQSGII